MGNIGRYLSESRYQDMYQANNRNLLKALEFTCTIVYFQLVALLLASHNVLHHPRLVFLVAVSFVLLTLETTDTKQNNQERVFFVYPAFISGLGEWIEVGSDSVVQRSLCRNTYQDKSTWYFPFQTSFRGRTRSFYQSTKEKSFCRYWFSVSWQFPHSNVVPLLLAHRTERDKKRSKVKKNKKNTSRGLTSSRVIRYREKQHILELEAENIENYVKNSLEISIKKA